MRITVDATPLLSRKFGIGYYVQSLVSALAVEPSSHRFSLLYQFLRPRTEPLPFSERLSSITRRLPFRVSETLFDHAHLPGDRFCGNPDLFHATAFFLPRMRRTRTVWTIHDLSFLIDPLWFPAGRAASLTERIRRGLERADHVIAVSDHTRRDLIEHLEFPPDRITVVHEAAPSLPPPTKPASSSSKSYFLCVGTLEPRKNIPRAIEAFSTLDSDHDLFLAGARGWKDGPIFEAIENSPRRKKIRWLGYVTPAELATLYRDAAALVYPSFYEGFGLPVLEAMSHGCPVICSRTSSLPEIAADAAILVSPDSSDEIAQAMRRLADSPAEQRLFSERGRVRAGEFSWAAAAKRTITVYEKAMQVPE